MRNKHQESLNLLHSLNEDWLARKHPSLWGNQLRQAVWTKMSRTRRQKIARDCLKYMREQVENLSSRLQQFTEEVDLNLCKPGDELQLRNGEKAVYKGRAELPEPSADKDRHKKYPHLVMHLSDSMQYRYLDTGKYWYGSLDPSKLDVISVTRSQ